MTILGSCTTKGQKEDEEVKGEGNSVNYKYRMYEPRIGRFFAVDPLTKTYPYYSPYAFSGNRVIDMVEIDGLEPATPEAKQAGCLSLTPVTTMTVIRHGNKARNAYMENTGTPKLYTIQKKDFNVFMIDQTNEGKDMDNKAEEEKEQKRIIKD